MLSIASRTFELNALQDLWQQVKRGQAGLVLLQGEAGVGKSWLIQAFRQHQSASTVLVTHPPLLPHLLKAASHLLAQERDPAFLAAALRLHPDGPWAPIATEAGNTESQEVLTTAVAQALERVAWERGGLCLLIEDIHTWRRDDLGSLQRLLRRFSEASAPILVVTTSRPEKLDWWQGLVDATLVGNLAPTLLDLMPLHLDETDILVRTVLRASPPPNLTSWLHQRTAGHPLYSLELLRFLIEGGAVTNLGPTWSIKPPQDTVLPQGLKATLLARLELVRADPELWPPLAALAVLERPVSLTEWSKLARVLDEELADLAGEAVRLGLVSLELGGGNEQYALAHPLYPSLIRTLLPRHERRTLHFRAAESSHEPSERARHARLGKHPHATAWTWDALRTARSRFAHAEVARHAQALLLDGQEDQESLLWLKGEALHYQGELEASLAPLEACKQPEARWLMAVTLWHLGRLSDALERVRESLRYLEPPHRERLTALEASLLVELGRLNEARESRTLSRVKGVADNFKQQQLSRSTSSPPIRLFYL